MDLLIGVLGIVATLIATVIGVWLTNRKGTRRSRAQSSNNASYQITPAPQPTQTPRKIPDHVLFYPGDDEFLSISRSLRNTEALDAVIGELSLELRILVIAIPPEGSVVIPPTYYLESEACRQVLREHALLIDHGYIKLLSQFTDNTDYILDKRERYSKVARYLRYSRAYFSPRYHELDDLNFQIAGKSRSVGPGAVQSWEGEMLERAITIGYPTKKLEELMKRVTESEQRAFLYESVKDLLNRVGVTDRQARLLRIRDSMSRTYLQSYGSQGIVIPQGSNLVADILIPSSASNAYNILGWRRLFEMTGVLDRLRSCPQEFLIRIKNQVECVIVLGEIREAFGVGRTSDQIAKCLSEKSWDAVLVRSFTDSEGHGG